VKISGSRTARRVAGQQVGRDAFKEGMQCTFVYPENGGEAREVSCR